jgi:hypothetical protein
VREVEDGKKREKEKKRNRKFSKPGNFREKNKR